MNFMDRLDNLSFNEKPNLVKELIVSFEAFLIANNVDLSPFQRFDAQKVISWGLPISFLNKECFSDPIFAKIIDSILENGAPDPNDFSEIQTIPLLFALGATSVEKVIENNERVHDFNVIWSDALVEVETTKASTKASHIERSKQAYSITELLFNLNMKYDVHAYISDLLEDDLIRSLLKAASNMKCGEVYSNEELWQLECHEITRNIYEIYKVNSSRIKPKWCPKGVANLFSIKQMLAGPESETAPPQVLCNYAVPITGYLNPVKKKARRFQGSSNRPYLIVIDVNNLPNPFVAFEEGLKYRLSKWLHVSGVLIYHNYSSQNEIGWEWQLYNNLNAKRPLPGNLVEKYGVVSQRMRFVKREA